MILQYNIEYIIFKCKSQSVDYNTYSHIHISTLDMCLLLHQIIIIDTRILLEESFYFRWSYYIDMIGCFCMVSVTQHNVY